LSAAPRAVEEPLLVGRDFVEPKRFEPCNELGAVVEHQLCDHVGVDRVVFSVELVTADEVLRL
jgi:hypothetical protein